MCISKRIKWILKKSHREIFFFCIFLQSTHQVDMKNDVECPGEFIAYFNALETTSVQRDRRPSAVNVIIFYIANHIFKQTYLHLWLKFWSKSIKNSAVICLLSNCKEEPKFSKNSYQNSYRKNTSLGFFCIYMEYIFMYDTKLLNTVEVRETEN